MQRVEDAYEARRRPKAPTPDEENATPLAQARFQAAFADIALNVGVRPSGVKYLLRDAIDRFTLTDDGEFVPVHGDRDPQDPLAPLTVRRC